MPRDSQLFRSPTLIVLLAVGVVLPAPGALADEPWPWRLEEIADGVYAALQPAAGRFDESNSLILIGEEDVLVVDAQAHESAVRTLIAEIRKLTDKPVRWVVNTHWHSDHTQGNAVYREVFGEAVTFVGHGSLRADVPGRAAVFVSDRVARLEKGIPAAETQLAGGVNDDGEAMTDEEKAQGLEAIARARRWLEANRGARFLAPDLTYEGRLTFHRGERTVELHHFVGHTRGDTVLYLPREKILVTGDLLDDLPYAGHGYPKAWIASLEKLRAFDFEILVPGHGPLFRGPAQIDKVLAFFRTLVARVEAAVAAGKDLDATREAVDAADLRAGLAGDDEAAGKFFDAVLGEAVERAFLEARGELPD